MKRKNELKELAERFDIPAEALSGELRISMSGKERVLVENHGGILEYTDETLVLAAGRGRVSFAGRDFIITAMNKNELLLKGKLSRVELE